MSFRFIQIYLINKPFIECMNYDKTLGKAKYYLKESGYIFKYSKASFFNADCFASVCTEEDIKTYIDKDGNIYTDGMQIVLFIWPNEHTYGLDFYQCDEKTELREQVYIDDKLNYISENTNEEYQIYINELIDTYKEDIEKLLKEAKNKWEL